MHRIVRSGCFALLGWHCMITGAAAQSELPRLVPNCDGTFDLCGFVDSQTKAEVIPRRFEQVFPFSEGLATVRLKGRKYAVIDRKGMVVFERDASSIGEWFCHQSSSPMSPP